MSNNGWIKIHRSILHWEWYEDSATFKLFLHLILVANYNDKKFKGEEIQRGEVVRTYANLAKDSGLTIQQVRTALKKLESTGEIKICKHLNTKSTRVTVLNYTTYQDEEEATNTTSTQHQHNINTIPTQHQHRDKKEKNNKKDKKVNKIFIIPTIQEIYDYAQQIDLNYTECDKFFDYYNSKGWMVGRSKMKDWQSALRNWQRNNFNKQGTNNANITGTGKRGTQTLSDIYRQLDWSNTD